MRRHNPTTMSLDHSYSDVEREFMLALDRYKRQARRPHPTWSEVFAVAWGLGYRRVAEPEEPYRHLLETEHGSA